ncbi:MAG: lipid-A-disaccharide synthase, partial [Desulfobacterales bacterium]
MDHFSKKKRIMIIAGETSGDLHGAKLVSAMQKRNNGLVFCGIGGRSLKETGVDILIDASEISVVGITEVFSKTLAILRGMRVVKRVLKTTRPDLLILID